MAGSRRGARGGRLGWHSPAPPPWSLLPAMGDLCWSPEELRAAAMAGSFGKVVKELRLVVLQ